MIRLLFPLLAATALLALSACSDPVASCDAPNLMCSETCVNADVDPNHCGGCDNACGGNFICSDGGCVCPSGKTDCDGRCVDLRTDSLHCGACEDSVCTDGAFCRDGVCGCDGDDCTCPGEVCGDVCVDPQTDELNCGGCGIVCGDGQHCLSGVCAGGDLYAACFSSGQVVPFLKTSSERSGTIAELIAGPQSLALLGDRFLAVVGSLDSTLYVYERSTMDEVASMLLAPEGAQGPNHLVIQGERAYVVNSQVNTVQVVDLSEPSQPKTVYEIPTGEGTNPYFAAFDEAGTLWVTLLLTNQVLPLEIGENAGVAGAPIDLPTAEGSQPFPAGLAIVEGTVYVTLNNLDDAWQPAGNGRLAKVSVAEKASTGLVDLGASCKNPGFVVIREGRLAISCTGSYGADDGTVALFDPAGEDIHYVETGRAPGRMSVDPSRPGYLYVADTGGVELITVDADDHFTTTGACVPAEWEFVSDVLAAP